MSSRLKNSESRIRSSSRTINEGSLMFLHCRLVYSMTIPVVPRSYLEHTSRVREAASVSRTSSAPVSGKEPSLLRRFTDGCPAFPVHFFSQMTTYPRGEETMLWHRATLTSTRQ